MIAGNDLGGNQYNTLGFDSYSIDNSIKGQQDDTKATSRTNSEVSPQETGSSSDSGQQISTPTGKAYEDFIEKEMKNARLGHIAITNITDMEVDQSYPFDACISLNGSLENLTRDISGNGVPQTDILKVYPSSMRVRLAGDKFELNPISSEIQPVIGNDPTCWQWFVTPKDPGKHILKLTATIVIKLPDGPMPYDLPSYDKIINVKVKQVPLSDFALSTTKQNWQWILGTVITLFSSGGIGWVIYNRWKGKKKSK